MARISGRSWLRQLSMSAVRRNLRIVVFPHAGGTAASYGDWATSLPADIELDAAQYPGRSDRFGEPAVDDVVRMAAHISAQLLTLEQLPLILVGHSLGALVAYESALSLQRSGVQVLQLAVSASPPPRLAGGGDTHRQTDDELWATVCGFGGVAPEIESDGELRNLLLPVLRSDVRANELYEPPVGAPQLSCPVRCYHGIGDPLINAADLAGWGGITSGDFSIRHRPGGHFHVFENVPELMGDLSAVARQEEVAS